MVPSCVDFGANLFFVLLGNFEFEYDEKGGCERGGEEGKLVVNLSILVQGLAALLIDSMQIY